jgi:post-segregation antitoxin (ccd killing protein)
MRMPRMQVYLPDALYREVKERGLPASELLQEAIAAEVRRRERQARADEYVDELVAEVGEPSDGEIDRADALARRVQERAVASQAS